MIRNLFLWIDALASSQALRESDYGYAILLTIHVITIVMFAGLILMMDLRLLGWGNKSSPVSEVQHRLFPWQMFAMGGSALTGLALVFAQPLRYYDNNVHGTLTLLQAMVDAGVRRFVFSSSATVYGQPAQMPAMPQIGLERGRDAP